MIESSMENIQQRPNNGLDLRAPKGMRNTSLRVWTFRMVKRSFAGQVFSILETVRLGH